jgi:hypothetical protein
VAVERYLYIEMRRLVDGVTFFTFALQTNKHPFSDTHCSFYYCRCSQSDTACICISYDSASRGVEVNRDTLDYSAIYFEKRL